MFFGFGRGMGRGRGVWRGMGRGMGGGRGFGFRGSSPPWPYVGIGRGGLPRCGYFYGGYGSFAPAWPYQQPAYYGGPEYAAWQPSYSYPAGEPRASGTMADTSQMTRDEELDFLKNEARAIGEQLEQIEKRIQDIESEK